MKRPKMGVSLCVLKKSISPPPKVDYGNFAPNYAKFLFRKEWEREKKKRKLERRVVDSCYELETKITIVSIG